MGGIWRVEKLRTSAFFNLNVSSCILFGFQSSDIVFRLILAFLLFDAQDFMP